MRRCPGDADDFHPATSLRQPLPGGFQFLPRESTPGVHPMKFGKNCLQHARKGLLLRRFSCIGGEELRQKRDIFYTKMTRIVMLAL